MSLFFNSSLSRRALLTRMGQLSVTGVALPTALNLAAWGEAAAFNASDYKALVCVFLYGGDDSFNTVIPYDTASYGQLSALRGSNDPTASILPLHSDLTATRLTPTTTRSDGLQFALHPRMAGLARLFNLGQAAVTFNVGPLVVPTTRAQFEAQSVPLPPKLFSHNDQQSIWQAESPEGATVGWGGRMGDLALSSNGLSQFTCISAAGNAVFLTGVNAAQYQISPNGAVPIWSHKQMNFGSSDVRDAIRQVLTGTHAGNMESDYLKVVARSVEYEGTISAALETANITTPFPAGNRLSDQLKIVARLIKARGTLGAKRQVFFTSLGGFDFHDNQKARQPVLLQQLSEAVSAFYQATVDMGVADKVTTFTASEFGRKLTLNQGGSDHGWGGHNFMVGGAIRGATYYGTPPPLSAGNTSDPNDQWNVGRGRLLPSTSLTQFAATLATWFGVQASELPVLLPNAGNFGGGAYPMNLGFLPS